MRIARRFIIWSLGRYLTSADSAIHANISTAIHAASDHGMTTTSAALPLMSFSMSFENVGSP
jgi:hypothetical protein